MKKFIYISITIFFNVCIIYSLIYGLTGCATEVDNVSSGIVPEIITLTSINVINNNIDVLIGGDRNRIPVIMELEKRTRIHIESVITTAEEYDTKLSLLITSGDAPDIFSLPSNFPGGPAKAAEDGIIVKINQYWDEFAPNYKRVVTSNPEWEKSIKSDNGDVYTFAFIKEDKSISVFFGPMLRKDLLDTAGLAVPETIDEWYTVLKAFKQQGVKNPFTALNWFVGYSGAFTGAYGVSTGLVIGTDGKIHFGPVEPGFKDFLTTFRQWYKEGLIDPDYVTMRDWRILDAKMFSGQSASTLHFVSNIANYTKTGKQITPDCQYVAAKYPVLAKGDKPLYGQCDQPTKPKSCINAKSKYIEEAMRYVDYGYSNEGQLLLNFGIEGESYTMDSNGNPVYTDLITETGKNTEGWSQEQALEMYCPASTEASTIQMKAYFEQIRLFDPFQKNAVGLWADTRLSSSLPNLAFSKAELTVTRKYANIDTYVQEMTARFIIDAESMDNFDIFVQHCKNMGSDDVVKVYNDALKRFNKR